MIIVEHYEKQILKVLIHIDENLDEKINIENLANIACYSPFHFHKVFSALMNESVYQYIKRIRLEKASGKLAYSNVDVTSIALDSGFDTPSSFTKAFKKFHGNPPKNFRAIFQEMHKNTYNLKDLKMIQPEKIENLKEMTLLFVRKQGNYIRSAIEAWKILDEFIARKNLNKNTIRYFGISHDDPKITEESHLRYDACITAPSSIKEEGQVGKQVLKGGLYAIFEHKGAYEGLEKTFNEIFLKWLPTSKKNYDELRPTFCEYFHKECRNNHPEKLITKVFIPLK